MFENLASNISSGDLVLEDFDRLININKNKKMNNKEYEKWRERFIQIMKFGKMNDKARDERLRQFDIYLNINKINEISIVLLEIKDKFKLNGDFSLLETISTSVSFFLIFGNQFAIILIIILSLIQTSSKTRK